MTEVQDTLAPALFKTEGLAAADLRLRAALVAAANQIKTQPVEAFAVNLDSASAEVLATSLVSAKDIGDAQLSYALYVLRQNRAYLEAGFDTFQEYVETKIQISAPKASALASRWQMFLDLGLSTNMLAGDTAISWNKFGELTPGVKAGVVTPANVELWLPLIAQDGEFSLTNSGIARLLKAEIADAAAEDTPEKLETFSIRTTADNKAYIQRYVNTIMEASGMLTAGEAVVAALEAKVTEIATDSEDIRKNYGLVRFKQIAERMAEGIQVIFLADPKTGYTKEALGVVPYTKLYSTMPLPGRCALAIDENEARELLGGDVYSIDIELLSDDVTQLPAAVETEPVYIDADTPTSTTHTDDKEHLRELTAYNKELAADVLARKLMTKADIKELKEKLVEEHGSDKAAIAEAINQALVSALGNEVS